MQDKIKCNHCNGNGGEQIASYWENCGKCHGTGKIDNPSVIAFYKKELEQLKDENERLKNNI